MLHSRILYKLLRLNQDSKLPIAFSDLAKFWVFLCSPVIRRKNYVVQITEKSSFYSDTMQCALWLAQNCDAWAICKPEFPNGKMRLYVIFAESDEALAFKLVWT